MKKPKTKDYLRHISNSLDDMTCEIRENNRLLVDQVKVEQDKLKYEKETKDRVDISLKEYEQLKRDLKDVRGKLERCEAVFETLKLNQYIDYIDPHSMTISTLKDPERISTRVLIQFECKTMLEFPFERNF